MGGGPMGGGPMGGGRGGTAGATSNAQALIEGRYVDDKGMPLSATAAEYPYTEHPYAEFKMMPIRMNLVMDQRRLPKLLVECANSNMPIEICRVRVLKGTDGATRSRARTGRGGGRGMMEMGPMRGRMGGGNAVRTLDAPTEAGTHDVPVEIYGLISIYNPPDREKLGTGAASQEEPLDAAATGVSDEARAETATPPAPAGEQNP